MASTSVSVRVVCALKHSIENFPSQQKHDFDLHKAQMKREAGGQGEFLLCPQGKAASPRFMGVIVLGDVC